MKTTGDFSLKKSNSGLGLYANRNFKKDEYVIEYSGILLTNEQADRKGGKYLFQINSRWTVDGSGRENLSRYINHSCKPNCRIEIRSKRIMIYANRRIKNGEELSYDYGEEYFDFFIKDKGCRCSNCLKKK